MLNPQNDPLWYTALMREELSLPVPLHEGRTNTRVLHPEEDTGQYGGLVLQRLAVFQPAGKCCCQVTEIFSPEHFVQDTSLIRKNLDLTVPLVEGGCLRKVCKTL